MFGDKSTGAYLVKHNWTGITRPVMVAGGASPDDPDLEGYWGTRRRRARPAMDSYSLSLLARQQGRCPLCTGLLLDTSHPPASPEDWENWWLSITRRSIPRAPSTTGTPRSAPPGKGKAVPSLVHVLCARRHRYKWHEDTARLPA